MAAPGKAKQVQEIIKCGKNPNYFFNNYVKIQHPVKGLIKFDTFEFQDDCVDVFNDERFSIVLKSRQLGLSTLVAAYSVWMAIFHVVGTHPTNSKWNGRCLGCRRMLSFSFVWMAYVSNWHRRTDRTSQGGYHPPHLPIKSASGLQSGRAIARPLAHYRELQVGELPNPKTRRGV